MNNKKNTDIGSFVFSIFFAPVLGLLISVYLAMERGGIGPSSELVGQAALMKQLSQLALAATIFLPLGYAIAVWLLARNRAALARAFPLIVRFCLLLLPVILVAHAVLIAFEAFMLVELGLMRPNSIWVIAAVLLSAALLLAGFNILAGMRQMLAIEPLRVTGLVIDAARIPDLHARVQRVAQKLGSLVPSHVVIGIEPTFFMTSMPVKLRGQGDLPEGETLYVPSLALQVLDDGELDALIAHELAHFRGPDLEFSRRFAPARKGLENAVDSVADDDESENKFIRMAKVPAYGLLSFMLWVLRKRLVSANVERELLADRAALEVASAPKLVSMVIKLTALSAQWPAFREGLASLMNRGVGRRNIAQDYLARIRTFVALTDQKQLLANLSRMSTPHPLDSHLQLESRAYGVQIDEKPMIPACLLALRAEKAADPALTAIEIEITAGDLDYTRVPGHPIMISEERALPRELAWEAGENAAR